jgi:hypothetical protein
MTALALVSAAFTLRCAGGGTQAAELDKLRVLYVGEPADSARARQVRTFLSTNVARIGQVDRRSFKQDQAADFDVVLLDWPQTDKTEQERKRGSPLGKRSTWTKPTVLLGSAGLNLAIVWKVRGGSG